MRSFLVMSLCAAFSLVSCKQPSMRTQESDPSSVAMHRRFFGFGENVATWLYAYQRDGEQGKRCWYYKELRESDPAFEEGNIGMTHLRAMSSAQKLVEFPLEDKYVKEHLQFWGAVNFLGLLADYAAGPASCQAAVVSAGGLLTPLAPVAFVAAVGAAAFCGFSIVGVARSGTTLAEGQAVLSMPATAVFDASATDRQSWDVQRTIRDAVKAKADKADYMSAPCLRSSEIMQPVEGYFSRNDIEACARMNSLQARSFALPDWCQNNGFAAGVNTGFCAEIANAPQGGVYVFRDKYLSDGLGFVGAGVPLKVLDRQVLQGNNVQIVVVKVQRKSGAFNREGAREGWLLSGFLKRSDQCG